MFLQEAAHLAYIFGCANKGSCHKVKSSLDTKEQVLLVRLTEEGQRQMDPRHIDPLAVGDPAPAPNSGVDLPLFGDIVHHEFDQAIIDEYPAAGTQIPSQTAIGNVGALHCSRNLLRCQDKVCAGLQHHSALLKHTQPDLRALGIQHGANGQIQLFPQAVHQTVSLQMLLMRTMGEVKPGHIHARLHHSPKGRLVRACRPQRTDDLCLAHQTIHHTFLITAVAVLFSLYRSSLEIATENALSCKFRSPIIECAQAKFLLNSGLFYCSCTPSP